MKKYTALCATAVGLFTAASMMAAGMAAAQGYPVKPIRVVVGFGAGTTSDVVGRILGKVMQQRLGQPVIVEPRPGAGGLIAGNLVKSAPPDGYTMYFGSVTSFTPVFTRTAPVDASKDYEPISDSLAAPYLMVVSTKLGINSFDELVAYAKARPQLGGVTHMVSIANQAIVMNAIASAKGFTYTDINVKNSAEAMPLFASGELALQFNVAGGLAAGFQNKIFRPIMVTAKSRLPLYPTVPTSGELGLPGLEQSGYIGGFWAPKGTPAPIARALSDAAQAAARDAEVVQQYARLEYEPVGSTPAEQIKTFVDTQAFWARVAAAANYQPPQ
jgi:tripartite-type tricarboxylate transporter receptor subunit TctC